MDKNWFTIQKIRQHIYAIAEFHHFEKVVSYLVVGKGKAVQFDTGLGKADIGKAVKTITKLPVDVFLTHAHWDHIGGIASFRHISVYNDPFETGQLKMDMPFHTVEDGQVCRVGGLTIQVIHTPGHSPGSTSYVLRDLNVLVVGDTLYPGPLYAHLPESNIPSYARSLKKLSRIAKENTLILPGHNATSCEYSLLLEAAKRMGEAQKYAGKGKKELHGQGFSILLS